MTDCAVVIHDLKQPL